MRSSKKTTHIWRDSRKKEVEVSELSPCLCKRSCSTWWLPSSTILSFSTLIRNAHRAQSEASFIRFEFSLENGELTNVCSCCLVFAVLGAGKQEEQASLVPGSIFWVRPLFLFFVRARTEPNRWAYIFRKKSSPTEKLSLWLKASITYSPFSLYLDIHYAQQGWKPFFLQNSLAN